MNKSEREKLAAIVAEMTFGTHNEPALIPMGQKILEEFPSIKPAYDECAEVQAGYRIHFSLVSACRDRSEIGQQTPENLFEYSYIIEEMLDIWAEKSGVKLTQVVEQSMPNSAILDSPIWHDLCQQYLESTDLSSEVYEFYTRPN